MTSPWSLRRFLTCRVREWASCLFPCRSPPPRNADNYKITNNKGGSKKTTAFGGGSGRSVVDVVLCCRDYGGFDLVARSSSDLSSAAKTKRASSRLRSRSRSRSLISQNGGSKTWIYDGRMMSTGSVDSYESDGSDDSFAFPIILTGDWSEGSPRPMPDPDKSQL